MKFFVDTADIKDIKELASTGLLDGVTTNPSLVAKSGHSNFIELIREITAIVEGPVSAEVASTDFEPMLAEARTLAKIADNVAVKVPLTPAGLKVCKILSDNGTMVNVTLCFSAAQAILAAKAGATFVSPFVGRLDDIGQNGMELISDICTIYSAIPSSGLKFWLRRYVVPCMLLRRQRWGLMWPRSRRQSFASFLAIL